MPPSGRFPHPLILGHRGAPFGAPENTILGFERAMQQGADGVELDVRLSADGIPVVIHDATLERTTGESGRVADLSWAELARVRSAGERIPAFEQAVAWAASANAWLNVELKVAGAEPAVLRLLAAGGLTERSFISSFDAAVVARVGELAPRVPRYLLTERWDAAARRDAAATGAHGICLGLEGANPAAMAELADLALPVVVWTVDDPLRAAELMDAGAAAVISNRPDQAVAMIRR